MKEKNYQLRQTNNNNKFGKTAENKVKYQGVCSISFQGSTDYFVNKKFWIYKHAGPVSMQNTMR